jgi:hypothetical protein
MMHGGKRKIDDCSRLLRRQQLWHAVVHAERGELRLGVRRVRRARETAQVAHSDGAAAHRRPPLRRQRAA